MQVTYVCSSVESDAIFVSIVGCGGSTSVLFVEVDVVVAAEDNNVVDVVLVVVADVEFVAVADDVLSFNFSLSLDSFP